MGYKNSKDINFYKTLKKSKIKKKSGSKKALWVMPPVILVLVLGGLFTYFYMQNMVLQRQVDKIDSYLTDPLIIEQNEELSKLTEDQTKLINQKNDFAGIWRALESYPSLKKELYATIELCSKDKIVIYDSSYTSQNGLLIMKAFSFDITSAATFIQNMKKTGFFNSVTYGGWNLGNDNQYNFTVTCVVAPQRQGGG